MKVYINKHGEFLNLHAIIGEYRYKWGELENATEFDNDYVVTNVNLNREILMELSVTVIRTIVLSNR